VFGEGNQCSFIGSPSDACSLSFNTVAIISPAKVGSSNFLYSIYEKHLNLEKVTHRHSLLELIDTIENKMHVLILVGIRNPIDRNLSYFFQTFRDQFLNDVKMKYNKYKGEYNYINIDSIITSNGYDYNELINIYFKQHYIGNDTYFQWYKEFFEILYKYIHINNDTTTTTTTEIDEMNTIEMMKTIKQFDKEKGYTTYKLPNNVNVLLYTLESLSNEKSTAAEDIIDILDLFKGKSLLNPNNSQQRWYKDIYTTMKKKIQYTKKYLNNNLKDNIFMNYCYTNDDINAMYDKYNIIGEDGVVASVGTEGQ
jgi:hypothetical protein